MTELELKIRSRDFGTLVEYIKASNLDVDISTIEKAYRFAENAHRDQKRLSGEPYITHPLEVSLILAGLRMDTESITAALLHDTVEDTGTTLEAIKNEFGSEIVQLVDGVTKISSIKNKSKTTAQAETLRKMLIATIIDIRVIIIKLADKLHNMRTIMFQPEEKKNKIAHETMDIYAPIARRLGMSKISAELEDTSFYVLHRVEYINLKKMISKRKTELEEYLDNVRSILNEKFLELDITAEITSRAKHLFSIYTKMNENNKTFDDIYDIRAIRIITNEIKDCYGILGIIHTLWSPIAMRFKDYIAVPKSNMYQSLHTTVMGPEGFPLEVQIRTEEMHATAEMGIAAHWVYKEKTKIKRDYKDLSLLQDITIWQNELKDSKEFLQTLKMDLYKDEIFVFTPKGKIVKLPEGATPIDFAYAIHTEIGNHTVGSKVNNIIVPLKTRLESGDIVEILTSKAGHPSEAWIKFVISPNAKYKIRNWFKRKLDPEKPVPGDSRQESEKSREEKRIEVAIPIDEQAKLRRISKNNRIGVSIEGASNVMIRLSQCCQPIPGDDVIGFITRGRGITVHKKECPSLKRLRMEKERFINIVWEDSGKSLYPVKIAVRALDRPNLLKDIADEIALSKTNIIKAEASATSADAEFKFILEVKNNEHLKDILGRIKKIKNIIDAYKVNEKVVLK
ncbi:MAG: bifunctional (p)ppGpp synthetase/guanosine-3',5'-bis(diphosphate) 3'-pyrophosphohydrolase [Spirochaetes bacterium]|jgi:GTP pyrophosphokinase|nr:bifunctional (p)ppGpp synthetase/guanosine-3',5'-bis(diphosphate) 3'-pyrophosphohydrolase [Spirochaetota bacterium]